MSHDGPSRYTQRPEAWVLRGLLNGEDLLAIGMCVLKPRQREVHQIVLLH
jgi:hypothetical protein